MTGAAVHAANPTPVLDAAVRELVDSLAQPPFLYELPVETGRQAFETLVTIESPADATTVDSVTLSTPFAGGFPVRVVRPAGVTGPLPIVLFVHGLGWTFGSFNTHERIVRALAADAAVAVVFPDYHLAPEHQYPTQIEESLASLSWAIAHASDLDLDAGRIAVVGDSVGGGMATVVAQLHHRRGGRLLAAQAIVYPIVDATRFDTPSYGQFADGWYLTRDLQMWFWDQYLPAGQDRADPSVSPLGAADADLAALPPTLVITAEADPVRDEGEAYAARLRQNGVEVLSTRYLGTVHDFARLDSLANTLAARSANAQISTFLRRRLATTSAR